MRTKYIYITVYFSCIQSLPPGKLFLVPCQMQNSAVGKTYIQKTLIHIKVSLRKSVL
jgi:hypothetical protein